ncbi:MAG: hypothetical protein L0Y66_14820 [Myxococcaceae bacterium]|nr:hypothetical protein [Myxococcaceae bacterium]MCI0671510.1 hypothetical protein [Myxococcaceae bacterium]
MSSPLVATSSLKEFFRTLLTEVSGHQQLQLGEGTEFYVANLLSEFAAADKLFAREEGGKACEEPLAVLYHRAQQAERDERIRMLRRLGDVSLYTVGFFAEALRERVVGPDYYIQMGGTAYGQVAELTPLSGFSGVYRELHDKFRSLVEVLEEIAARGLVQHGASGALRVYESWVRTGSGRLERVLVDAGLMPVKPGLPS